jgi:hypothetical protein
MTTKSWRPEVQTDDTGQWYPNGLRFATEQEAYANAKDLSYRWTAVCEYRAAESDDEPNYTYHGGELRSIVKPEEGNG